MTAALLQKTFGMNPAQRVIADAELAGLGMGADLLPVADVDTLVGQMRHEWHLVAEALRFKSAKSGSKGRIRTAFFQVIERGIVQHIILVAAAQ